MSGFSQIVLMYHCDSTDGRQQFRNKTFQNWFSKHSDLSKIYRHKIIINVEVEDTVKSEYLGCFAKCEGGSISTVSAEFELMANEKVNSGKQQIIAPQ